MHNYDYMVPKCKIKTKKSKLSNLFTKILLSIIFLLSLCIFMKIDDNNILYVEDYIFENNLAFTKINNLLEKYIGNVVPTTSEDTVMVFSSDLTKNAYTDYEDGVMISLTKGSPVNILMGGIVVYMGEKDNYGYTLIIQGNDGIDYWYGNITNTSVNLYDYLESNTLIGEANDNYIYLVFAKDNEYLSYEDIMQ